MSATLNKEAAFFETHFNSSVDAINVDAELIVAYDGVLNTETISRLEGEIEQKIIELNVPKAALKKIFFICVESLQNMLIHGHKDTLGAQHNYFLVYKRKGQIKIETANLINNSAIDKLKKDLTTINSFEDPAELKAYYINHLENNELSEKGGAGLGFITIGMKSGNKLDYSFDQIGDQFSLFRITASVNVE
ncbi:MAG: SiaB family protein kinase [Bacteroidia bacterium]